MRRALILTATGGSIALMLGALAFQYIGEMPPCKLCYWQRYGHVGAITAGVLALFLLPRLFALLAAVAAATSSIIGGYHSGVEQKWWEGPSSCTSSSIVGLTPDELRKQIMEAPLVQCDKIPWEMLGLSMAGWNMLASAGIAMLFVLAARMKS